MIYYILIIIWGLFLFWYVCTIISPNCLNNVSNEYLLKNEISKNSILNKIYINKRVFPRIKLIAITFFVLLIMNVMASIIFIVLFQIKSANSIIRMIAIVYILALMIIGTIPIVFLNMKRK